jgi:hypothetical protein
MRKRGGGAVCLISVLDGDMIVFVSSNRYPFFSHAELTWFLFLLDHLRISYF